MKTAIVGPGAMGCLFAAHLAEAGNDVVLIDYRQERAGLINSRGLIVEWQGNERTIPVRASCDPSAAADADGVIFMVKAYSTEAAALRLKDHIPAGSWVMSIQNGMGNTDILCGIYGAGRVLAGTTTHGATVKGPGNIRHAGKRDTWVGELDGSSTGRVKRIAALLTSSGIEANVSPDVAALLWKKLIVNVGINPVTSLLRIHNGELLERQSALEVSRMAVMETVRVAEASGVKLGDLDAFALVKDVAEKTGANISSMHQDIAAGRKTEIDFICGFVSRAGAAAGISTPCNDSLHFIISAIEKQPVVEE